MTSPSSKGMKRELHRLGEPVGDINSGGSFYSSLGSPIPVGRRLDSYDRQTGVSICSPQFDDNSRKNRDRTKTKIAFHKKREDSNSHIWTLNGQPCRAVSKYKGRQVKLTSNKPLQLAN
jgi:hypothetical protein